MAAVKTYVAEIAYKNILDAAKVCGDTSVLEALFPEVFTTEEGKKLLEEKEAEAETNKQKPKPNKKDKEESGVDVTSEADFVLRMDKKTLNAVASILGCFGGSPEGPRGAVQDVSVQLKRQGAEDTYFRIENKRNYLPSTWEEFEEKRFKIKENEYGK